MAFSKTYRPDPEFHKLGDDFSDAVSPTEFPSHTPRFWNQPWAEQIGLGSLDDVEKENHFAKFEPLPDNQSEPRAMRYHGHQFRSYNPQLGDGRGFLHAQMRDNDGRLLDLATKGTGQTPYSRTADGRLTLKGAVREVLAAQLLEALGVYTSKPFCVYETGEALVRHDEPSPARSAVLTRLGHSHLRFGTFQYHAYEQRPDRITALVDHTVENYYPALQEDPDAPSALLGQVVGASARLVASWMAAGFVHGVLNTDNLNVTGESFDYGPWRFLPHYEPGFTAAYFDETGLYAYGRQPEAVFWALQQLAGALSLAGDRLALEAVLNTFPAVFRSAMLDAFLSRFGVASRGVENDEALVRAFLAFMHTAPHSWEGVLFDWFGGPSSRNRAIWGKRASIYCGEAFDNWHDLLMQHDPVRALRLEHDYFTVEDPTLLTIDVVEGLWTDIASDDDWARFNAQLKAIELARRGYDFEHERVGFA
jgi:uncharacterized protein YdiU (UPF0061 family)